MPLADVGIPNTDSQPCEENVLETSDGSGELHAPPTSMYNTFSDDCEPLYKLFRW